MKNRHPKEKKRMAVAKKKKTLRRLFEQLPDPGEDFPGIVGL